MDKDQVKSGDWYLFRLRGKQVPVKVDKTSYQDHIRYVITRVDTGAQFTRRSAGGLSRHFEDCYLIRRRSCKCFERLTRLIATYADETKVHKRTIVRESVSHF